MARTIVGEAYIQILPTDGGVAAGTQKIIDGLPNAVKVPVTAETEQASAAVAQLTAQIEGGLGGAWQQAAVQAATFTAAVLGVRAAIEGAVNQLAGLFDQLAQAQAGFTAILGSQSAGQRLLDDIREFARVSPFVTQELVNYSQQLLGVGQSAESIVPLLRSTGDLIASVGGDTQNISRVLFTLTQIRSIGRLVGQDAIQLQSALVPITKLLADFLGKTTAEVKKLQEQGAISADTVFAAITNAGSKVEGAMATATRNISGARSVLQDTVQIMLQDSQTLNTVFQDIVQGILAFSDALGSNVNLQNSIQSIDEGLSSLYESIQPVIEAFGETGATIALDGLAVLASTLEVLSAVLESIPTEALELFGRALAILFAIRAPLALLNYTRSLGQLATVLQPANMAQRLTATSAGIAATGNAAAAAEPQIARLTATQAKYVTGLSAAAFGIGLFITSLNEENAALQTLGQTLSTTALGAQLGSVGGLPGVAIGAGVGAGIGLVTSMVTSAREEAARRSAEFEEIGAEAASKFQAGFSLTTPNIETGADFSKYLDEVERVREGAEAVSARLQELRAEQERILGEGQNFVNDPSAGAVFQVQTEERLAAIEAIDREIKKLEGSLETADAKINALFGDGQYADAAGKLATVLSTLRKESEGFGNAFNDFLAAQFPGEGSIFSDERISANIQRGITSLVLFGDATVTSEEQLQQLEDAAASVGLSIEQFLSLPIEDLINIFEDKLPSALTQARIEINATTTAFQEAKKATDEFFKPFGDQVKAAQSALQANAGLTKAADAFLQQQTDQNALAYAEALLKVTETVAAANEAAFKGTGQTAGVSFLISQLDILQETLSITDEQFRLVLRDMGLLALYDTGISPGFTGSVQDLAEQVGLSVERLRELLPSLQEVGNREFSIPISTLDALNQLATLTGGLEGLPVVGAEAVSNMEAAFLNLDLVSPVQAQVEQIKQELLALDIETRRALSGDDTFGDRLNRQRNVAAIEEFNRQKAAEEARLKAEEEAQREAERLQREQERLAREAEQEANRIRREQEAAQREAERLAEEQKREQERLRQALKDSSETIQQSMERASETIANAARQWTASILERVQDERPVSTSRLIRNAQDQANRLTELDAGTQELQRRGLSQSTIAALGIDNVTDVRQLRRLLGSSDSELRQLNDLVALRDSNAEAIARRERQAETQATIVAAIIQAATILGYEITPQAARALALQVNVTGDPATAVLPTGIIEQIQNAGVLLRT